MEMDPLQADLLRLLRIAETRTRLCKEPILNEVRRIATRRAWAGMSEPEKAYLFGIAKAPLPAAIEKWDDLSLESQLAVSKGIAEWAFLPRLDPENAASAPPSAAASVGC